MLSQTYPILEFDSKREAAISPRQLVTTTNLPEHCVITFFHEVIEELAQSGDLKLVASSRSESAQIPIYQTTLQGKPVCIAPGQVGAPCCVGLLEELIAMGCNKFIVCGGAGVLCPDIALGHLIVPESAIRDEGTSYHYLPPSREISCDPAALAQICQELKRRDLPYLKAKTWTTDAFYRETRDKIALRIAEGCITVEMEASALFAAAQFREVQLAQILYGGDDLSGTDWDQRNWNTHTVRGELVALSLDICVQL